MYHISVRTDAISKNLFAVHSDVNQHSHTHKAINWKGEFDVNNSGEICVAVTRSLNLIFKLSFNPQNVNFLTDDDITTDVTIHILDEPISPVEVSQQIRKMKPDRACEPDGLPPGLFALFPAQWI